MSGIHNKHTKPLKYGTHYCATLSNSVHDLSDQVVCRLFVPLTAHRTDSELRKTIGDAQCVPLKILPPSTSCTRDIR